LAAASGASAPSSTSSPESHRLRHLLRHRSIRPHGRRALGVLAWKEFAGAPGKAKMYLALMFVFYCVGILLVARANG